MILHHSDGSRASYFADSRWNHEARAPTANFRRITANQMRQIRYTFINGKFIHTKNYSHTDSWIFIIGQRNYAWILQRTKSKLNNHHRIRWFDIFLSCNSETITCITRRNRSSPRAFGMERDTAHITRPRRDYPSLRSRRLCSGNF